MKIYNNKPTLLSIITVNLNNDFGLAATLASLVPAKNSSLIELILVDGASTDQSLRIADEFDGFDQVICEPDNGIFNAMNKGLSRANGKYIMWINSGDELDSGDALATCLRHLSRVNSDVFVMSLKLIDPHYPINTKTINADEASSASEDTTKPIRLQPTVI
jgi:glycosyltransferase involved in cell wall biosynthesis